MNVRLPQRLKSMFFEIFLPSAAGPFGAALFEKFQKTLFLALEANCEVSLNCTFFKILANCILLDLKTFIINIPSLYASTVES